MHSGLLRVCRAPWPSLTEYSDHAQAGADCVGLSPQRKQEGKDVYQHQRKRIEA